MTRGKTTHKGGRQGGQPAQVSSATEDAGRDLLHTYERLMRRVCEHTGWQHVVELQGDGTVAKITAWLGPSERPRAMLYMHVDSKYSFREVVVPAGYGGLPEVHLFENALIGEIKSLAPPESAQKIEERWQRALSASRGARGAVKKRGGPNLSTQERVKKYHEVLKRTGKVERARKASRCDPRTYQRYCSQVTGEEPVVPYSD